MLRDAFKRICSPEVSGGDSLWYMVVECVAHRVKVSLCVANLAVLFDTILIIIEVLSLHTPNVPERSGRCCGVRWRA
jgi:hypothetical protein